MSNPTAYQYSLGPSVFNDGDKHIKKWSEIKNGEGYRADVAIKTSTYKGMGVFALRNFDAGEVLEYCHCAILQWGSTYQRDLEIIKYGYGVPCHCKPSPTRPPCLYNCPVNGHRWIVPFGFGSIYNCSDKEEDSNTGFVIVPDERLLVFVAKKPIGKGEEALTWWGQGYWNSWCKEPYEQAQRKV